MIEHCWSLCYQWHVQIMPIGNVNTQTIFMVIFTSGSLFTWGEPLDASSGISPRYLSTTYSQFTVSPFFYRHPIMTYYSFFSQGLDKWGKGMALLWGNLIICPSTTTVPHTLHNSSRAILPYQPQGLGEKQKIHHNITFLLILAEEEATGDRKYGLLAIWVNPCQARVHSMEEVVRKLTAWVSNGPNWPYVLVWRGT